MVVHTIFRAAIPVPFFLFIRLFHQNNHFFWLLFEPVLSCTRQVPGSCLFPLMVDLLPFPEPLVWVSCSLGGQEWTGTSRASQGTAGHCLTSHLSSKHPGSWSSRQVWGQVQSSARGLESKLSPAGMCKVQAWL